MTHGFPTYYTATHLAVRGEWGPQAYDNAWYGARVQALLGQREADPQGDQSLLGAVVQIALEARALRVGGLDEPAT